MKQVFISQPMNGRSEEEILKERQEIMDLLKIELDRDEDYVLIDNYHKENIPAGAGRLWYLGTSISLMDGADIVVFAPGWVTAKGCRIERKVVENYLPDAMVLYFKPACLTSLLNTYGGDEI